MKKEETSTDNLVYVLITECLIDRASDREVNVFDSYKKAHDAMAEDYAKQQEEHPTWDDKFIGDYGACVSGYDIINDCENKVTWSITETEIK